MKKNIIDDIDKMKEERKIPKEVEQKILTRAVYNWGVAVLIITLILVLNFTIAFLPKNVTTDVCNLSAMVFLIFSITITEIAYKKNRGKWAIIAIEMITVSIFTLFAPQIFAQNSYNIIHVFIAITALYYSSKIIGIYYVERKEYLTEISDITNIIKKESNDILAEQEKEKRKEELKKLLEEEQNKETKPKRKPRTKKKKEEVETEAKPAKKKTTTRKTTSKKSATASKEKKTTKKTGTAKKENEISTQETPSKRTNTKPKVEKTAKKVADVEPSTAKKTKKAAESTTKTTKKADIKPKTTTKSSTAPKTTTKKTTKTTKKEINQGE